MAVLSNKPQGMRDNSGPSAELPTRRRQTRDKRNTPYRSVDHGHKDESGRRSLVCHHF